ncbi:hypothetical protein [Dethiobacter alkaliphilus]|uniref:hypothetical protein n=1 Tax=Dethiobacter alkaliphilus TaxID=427926 RepID=UPI002226B0BD|nr:hypothetical protein [Dethiobacter alkaliphilus]MCW3488689.1 hypothetical protein [Dethiobacter alkaliphilus]
MKNKQKYLEGIKKNLVTLEKENRDEFDMITAVFSILYEATGMLGHMYDEKKVKEWKQKDDPSFYRFASTLKTGLELQWDYLNSISRHLVSEGDIVSQKVAAYQEKMKSLLKREKNILKEAGSVIKKEDELQEANKRVEALLNKKMELEEIEKKLANLDIREIEGEIARKEKVKADLEDRYRPLLNKQKDLENSITEISNAMENISVILSQLEAVSGKESRRLAENLPQWIDVIQKRQIAREEKEKEYMNELLMEAERLQETEKKIQEHLEKMNKFVALAMDNREILRTHFEANKTLNSRIFRSLKSLGDMSLAEIQENLSAAMDGIEKDLDRFDASLKEMHMRIQEIATSIKPMGVEK